MNENLPIQLDAEREGGSITYANEVIAIIAGMAANEVEGVAQMVNNSSIADLFGRTKPVTRGVKVEVGSEEASIDLVLTVEYGKPIQKVCVDVQESVRKAIESMTGLHVVKVDVHVVGVSFEKETQEMQKGYVKATQSEPEAAFTARQGNVFAVETPDTADDDIDIDIPEGDSPGTVEADGDFAWESPEAEAKEE